MWPPATFIVKQKKSRTKRNPWLFDSPATCCISPATWNLSDSPACGNQTYLSLIRGTPGNTCDFTKVSLENNGWGCRVGHLPDISIIITGSTKKVHVIGAKSWFYVERGVQVTREGAKWFLPQWSTTVHVDLVISAASEQTWVGGVQNKGWKTCNEEQWWATILARNLRTLFSPVPFCNDLN